MSKKQYKNGFPCAITQEALDMVKVRIKNKYDLDLSDKQALWLCGFIIDKDTASLNISDGFYRHQTMPSKISHGKIWRGWVRNEVDREVPVSYKGEINYSNKLHHMQPIYFSCEVVTGDIVPSNVLDIYDIGDKLYG